MSSKQTAVIPRERSLLESLNSEIMAVRRCGDRISCLFSSQVHFLIQKSHSEAGNVMDQKPKDSLAP